jgi:Ca2+-binding EF-hand superfamily protein
MREFLRLNVISAAFLVSIIGQGRRCHADDTNAPAEPHSVVRPYQDLLFLGRDRVFVIRMNIEVDGQPFGDVWQAAVQRLFALADRNGDGMLSTEERQSPAQSDVPLQGELLAVLTTEGLSHADIDPPDGMISSNEFAAFVSQRRGGAFQGPPATPGAKSSKKMARGGPNPVSGEALFKVLDKDQDRRISEAELRDGPRSIHSRDFDGDGAASIDELDHTRSPFGQAPETRNTASSVPIVAVSPLGVVKDVMQGLITAYGREGTDGVEALPVSSLGIPEPELPRYDEDGNGVIDRRELRSYLSHPVRHLEFAVRVGERAEGKSQIQLITTDPVDGVTVKASDLGFVNIVLGDVQLEVSVNRQTRSAETMKANFVQQFKAIDADANGYLERKEAERAPLFEQSFGMFDRDGDGKLFEQEMTTVVEGRILTGLARTRMTATDRGKDLLEILDINRDGRLSQRELSGAIDRFAFWDIDSDKTLSADEIPQLYQIVFDRGVPDLPGFTAERVAVPVPMPVAVIAPATPAGPAWFVKMDRNGDGDVSEREFLGTLDQFRSLDRDADGLIDAEEAVVLPLPADQKGLRKERN